MFSLFGKTFSHGIHPAEKKHLTAGQAIKRLPFPEELVLLMNQHAGKPAIPCVAEGQEVLRGALLAKADGFMSVPIHAPATGVVSRIDRALDQNGRMSPAIFLKPYPGSDQEIHTGINCEPFAMSPQELTAAIQNIGMVGLGGAAFPTHVKLSPPKGKTVESILVNGCECEPYLTSDHRVMLEQPQAVIAGVRIVLRAVGAKRAIIGIESNKLDAVEALQQAINDSDPIDIAVLQTKYPQGAEKMLTAATLGREIPSGGLPADIGTVVSNVATMAEIGNLLPKGRGLIERVITISGKAVDKPGNYLIPMGTPLNFVLDQLGVRQAALRQVIFGGPMMGKAVAYLETPITKGVSGILALSHDEIPVDRREFPCIRCGECLRACPMHLNPSLLGNLGKYARYEDMAAQHLYDCFECGSCSYVCPAHIPLVQRFRIAKEILREAKAATR